MQKKSAFPPRQCTLPQVHENDDQIEWINTSLNKFRVLLRETQFFREIQLYSST